jgi:hypothetical protein
MTYAFQPSEVLAQIRARPWLDQLCAVGLPSLSVLLFLLSTRHGIGVWVDSTRYMNLSSQPWDAPLYPALIHSIAALGVDIAVSAWIVGLVLAALNAFLVWYIIRVAGGRAVHAAVGALLIVIAPQTVGLHALAMSEPLFLTTICATLLLFMRYLRGDGSRWLLAAGLGVGLASLARFPGPALGAALAMFLMIEPRQSIGERLLNLGRILLPSGILFLGWVVLAEELNGRSTGRPLEWLGNMTVADWRSSFQALTAWIVPDDLPAVVRSALFLSALAASLTVMAHQGYRALGRAEKGRRDPSLLALPLAFFFFTYLAFMLLATSIEANLHLNSRYAYPIYCTSVMGVAIATASLQAAPDHIRRLQLVIAAVACLMLAGHAVRTAHRTAEAYRDGIGYASVEWMRSPTLAAVANLPKKALLYSNGADAIGYILRRPARDIPAPIMLRTGRDNPEFRYPAQLAAATADLKHGNTYVVFLNGITWRFYLATEGELVRRLRLTPVGRFADGTIYTVAGDSR